MRGGHALQHTWSVTICGHVSDHSLATECQRVALALKSICNNFSTRHHLDARRLAKPEFILPKFTRARHLIFCELSNLEYESFVVLVKQPS